jgi:hypothetical protein
MKSRLLAFCFILIGSPLALVAQDTSSITGTVTDPRGAAIGLQAQDTRTVHDNTGAIEYRVVTLG